MKVKANIQFRDKYTAELYKAGDILEVDEARGKELLSDPRSVVSEVKETETKGTPKKKRTKK